MKLVQYIQTYSQRGPCQCGQCVVLTPDGFAPASIIPEVPKDHTADLVFFKVHQRNGASAADLKVAILAHAGEYEDVNLFDHQEHSYLEIGGFVGDQGLAMQLMGLGALLGLWKLLTPYTVLGKNLDPDRAMSLAQAGLVTILAKA
jgi:hypothetical protein